KYIIPDLLQQFLPVFLQFLQTEHGDLNLYMLIGEIAAAEKRITYLSRVAHFGLSIWGDPGWKVAENTGVKYMGYAGHLQQLNEIYSISRINLDVNRIYQMDIVPMRVFDILACEGFLLAEYSPELERLFKIGEELECYTCVEELESKIQYYLQHPEAAQKIARRGYLAVRKRHTITHRLNQVLATIKDETPATL
ncbi:MAG: glycosyltransferase family 1 protein, partial [Calditrichaeota bacterium]